MGTRIVELIERLIDKVRQLAAPPMVPVLVPSRRRR
jgi:hypothetical protein